MPSMNSGTPVVQALLITMACSPRPSWLLASCSAMWPAHTGRISAYSSFRSRSFSPASATRLHHTSANMNHS